jgi:hypothetical protein
LDNPPVVPDPEEESMTTATYTPGLQAMYSPAAQQFPVQGWQQQFGLSQMPYAQPATPFPVQYQYQYPQISPLIGQGYGVSGVSAMKPPRQLIAAELFRLGQLVQASGQLVGPQPGKPPRQAIAAELFRLGQIVQQSAVHAHPQSHPQYSAPFGVQQQIPIWS